MIDYVEFACILQAKYERALREKERGRSLEVVTPDWVCDSVKGGVKCDEALYHPGLLLLADEKKDVDPLATSLANITGFSEPEQAPKLEATTPQPTLAPEQKMERLMEMLEQRKVNFIYL